MSTTVRCYYEDNNSVQLVSHTNTQVGLPGNLKSRESIDCRGGRSRRRRLRRVPSVLVCRYCLPAATLIVSVEGGGTSAAEWRPEGGEGRGQCRAPHLTSAAQDGPPHGAGDGGAGYVGSHTVVELLQEGHSVVVVDNCCNAALPHDTTTPTEEAKNGVAEGETGATKGEGGLSSALPPALQRVEDITGKTLVGFYLLSLTDSDALARVFTLHKIDAVIHFAALKAVGESMTIPLEYYVNNVSGTLNLLQVMREAGVKRLVYSSSATVYGAPQYLPTDEAHPTGQGITNPYGRTKYFCEQVMMDLAAADQEWGVLLLRYFNPVGAHSSGRIGEDPRDTPNNLMPYIAQVAVGRLQTLQVYGQDYDTPDGTGVRDYVHVVDLATGHVAALEQVWRGDFRGCESYNLGSGQGVSVLEMIKAFSRASGRDIPYVVKERRAGDVAKMVASCTRAQQDLGWQATRTLSQMCEDTWRWQSQNPRGYI